MNRKSRRNLYFGIAIVTIMIGSYGLISNEDKILNASVVLIGFFLIIIAYDEYRKAKN